MSFCLRFEDITKKEIDRAYITLMKSRKRIGKLGEDLALQYLERSGFQLVERNCRIGRGEIDIIAIREGLLVFAEVKTRSSPRNMMVEDMVGWYQQQKIKQTAYRYLNNKRWEGRIRFDLLMVCLSNFGRIQHYQGYFH